MRTRLSVYAVAVLVANSLHAESTFTAFVREITVESINAAPLNPEAWVQKQHDSIVISSEENEPVLGELQSTYPIGKGLWFGLYAENNSGEFELIASRIIGAQPTAQISIVSMDSDTNDGGAYTEPITRADLPFTVSIDISNISDDALLQQPTGGSDVVDDLVTIAEYPPATKYMKLTRHVSSLDENDVETESLVDSAYTHGEGQVFLTRGDDGSDVTTRSYGENEVFSLLSTGNVDYSVINGREIYRTHVVPNYGWDGSNLEGTSFVESGEASIRVLPTAFSDAPTDANDRAVEGELYFALPNMKWPAKNLYPRSETRIALYSGDPDTTSAIALSEAQKNASKNNVQDITIFWDLSSEGAVVNSDGVNYTAVLETKTPMDIDGNGSADDWEEIARVSFFYNREINVNGVVVSGE